MGERVRYDGDHRRQDPIVEFLGPHVEWVRVCPELDVGMGVPREPVHIVAGGRMIGVESGQDWTERMTGYAAAKVSALDVHGYILKARSPSCGLTVTVHGSGEPGRGLFAAALTSAYPDMPIVEEEDLTDAATCERFAERVRAYQSSSV